jgi:hypothetical protein
VEWRDIFLEKYGGHRERAILDQQPAGPEKVVFGRIDGLTPTLPWLCLLPQKKILYKQKISCHIKLTIHA